MRQGDDKPGLIGAGFVVSEVIVGPHWDASKPKAWVSYFANIRWDTLGEIPLIPLPELVKATNEERLWIQEGSGLPIPRELTARLESILHDALRLQSQPTPSPTSVSEQTPTTPAETAPLADAAPAQPAQPTTATPERPVPNAPAAPQAAGIPDVPAAPKPPEEWVLSDRPLEDHFRDQDRFQFGDYASSLAAVLDHPKTETPFTMAIHAPWGAGKTTLANMIAEQLKQRPLDRGQAPHIICWFNAWMHDDATNLATALIAEVGRTADGFRGLYHRIFHPLPFSLLEPRSRNWRRAILLLLILAPTLALSVWLAAHLQHLEDLKKNRDDSQITVTVTKDASGKELSRTESSKEPSKRTDSQTLPKDRADRLLETFQSRMLVLSAFFTAVAGLLGFLVKAYTSTSLGGFVQSPDKAAETGAISSAEKQLRDLITQATWRGNRFVIFIDDIERCKPPRSIDVLDAVSQLLSQKGVIVVLLGDMSAVAAAAQLKYKDIAEIVVPSAGIAQPGPDRGKEAFGRLYLQKIIQFQFDLPIPPMDKIQDYMRRLVVPATEVPPTDVVQTEEVTHG
jgi:HAMP domain-containing protein